MGERTIGQRYLRRVLTTFKFELNVLVAVLGAVPGTVLLWHYEVLPGHGLATILSLSAALSAYLFGAALEDSKLLHRLRGDLIEVAREQRTLPSQSV